MGVGVPIAILAGWVSAGKPEMRAVYPLNPGLVSGQVSFLTHALTQLLYYSAWEILFRGVLDVALGEKITDRLCAKHGDDLQLSYTLEDRIKTVEKLKLFDRDFIKRLNEIRLRGNKCVHGDMQAVPDIKGTIVDTCKALIAICEVNL